MDATKSKAKKKTASTVKADLIAGEAWNRHALVRIESEWLDRGIIA